MNSGDQDENKLEDDLQGLEEATAGYDPYLSRLLNSESDSPQEERRSEPRDTTPARRRSILASGEDEGTAKAD